LDFPVFIESETKREKKNNKQNDFDYNLFFENDTRRCIESARR